MSIDFCFLKLKDKYINKSQGSQILVHVKFSKRCGYTNVRVCMFACFDATHSQNSVTGEVKLEMLAASQRDLFLR